jgi:hypothetical protein
MLCLCEYIFSYYDFRNGLQWLGVVIYIKIHGAILISFRTGFVGYEIYGISSFIYRKGL